MALELTGLQPAVRRCAERELEVIVLLNRSDQLLDGVIDETYFALYCSPAINLFPRRADRIHINNRSFEFHVIPDRTRPMDLEVYQVNGVVGYGTSAEDKQDFLPFYHLKDRTTDSGGGAYYMLHREPRLISSRQRAGNQRSSYLGSEVFVSLVDAREAPYSGKLRQLAVETLCTNRDLPLHMPVGRGTTDFTMDVGGPVRAVRCLAGPTEPRPPLARNEVAWRLINHLSLN